MLATFVGHMGRILTGIVLAAWLLLFSNPIAAQDTRWLKREIRALCAPSMAGRGYVQKGQQRAAQHIQRFFKNAGLKPILPDSGYRQAYHFPVVCFPDTVMLRIGRKELIPGVDFLVDAAADSYRGRHVKIKKLDVGALPDSAAWQRLRASLHNKIIYLIRGGDSLARLLHIPLRHLTAALPKGVFIIPVQGKMTWTVATKLDSGKTVLYVQDSVLPRHPRRANLALHSRLERSESVNVMGYVPGLSVPDSFIVFTAHYDHLGKMGWDATFPGASDNASGTACIEWLASRYAQQPQRYSMLFVAFSGEEAGLLGSSYFVKHAPIPLKQVRFLVNLDIMGDAAQGVTVVNATNHPSEFSLLKSLNQKKNYLPEIRSRGNAANSDHYPFTQAGVPAIFLYSNGGPGYYHDVFDKPETLPLLHVDGVLKLLLDFVAALQ
ncbi:MAG: M28 family peptidase [Bacteroidetes bacterium]|nr:M28 family peptidase [Bacteroidota bacterium]MBS1629858.1 M28 family peptidase [Bacteroidota bacterium]